ncbi:MAG TPA: diguanylate cyclase [Solirubrobacteraceae bacterium]|jgi:diguanylate cyclase (GGDEF)-like protein|nr:diguanylate cyclase [Solirubrobacteraceae bacterium]
MESAPRPSTSKAGASTWLCRDDFDRERLLDMEDRLRPARRRTFAILTVAIASVGPWLGWWPLLFLIPASLCFATADRLMPRMAKPELLMFAAWIGSELAIAGAVALEGGARVSALSWLAIPVITLSSRFSMRGVVAGVAIACALAIAVAFGVDATAVVNSPELLTAPVVLIISVAVLSTPLMRSDIQHRSDAVIDQLTGMLNRNALKVRVQELTQQSHVTGEPIGLIVGDLDHFKEINDTHGHSVGDAVLKEVAYLMRKQLRAFDLAYRLGGEEFLILLPGSDLDRAEDLAERLRARVGVESVAGGIPVTMSFGVAASAPSESFDYGTVFAKADAALYRAKHEGRDRVRLAEPDGLAVPALA